MFSSETDAETVSHLIERHYEGDLVEAVARRSARWKGTSPSSPSTPTTRVSSSPHVCRPRSWWGSATARTSSPRTPPRSSARRGASTSPTTATSSRSRPTGLVPPRRRHPGRARAHRARLGPRGRGEGRLRDVHAEGDPRAARGGCRDDRRSGPARAALLEGLGMDDDELRRPQPDRHPRQRHRVPRGRRGPIRDRGVGARAGRARHRLGVGVSQPGARRGHARDRDLSVRRDTRHDRGDEAGPRRWARTRSRSPT